MGDFHKQPIDDHEANLMRKTTQQTRQHKNNESKFLNAIPIPTSTTYSCGVNHKYPSPPPHPHPPFPSPLSLCDVLSPPCLMSFPKLPGQPISPSQHNKSTQIIQSIHREHSEITTPPTHSSLSSIVPPSSPPPSVTPSLPLFSSMSRAPPPNATAAEGIASVKEVIGNLPFKDPNVRAGHEREDLSHHVPLHEDEAQCEKLCCTCLCGLSIIGCCYLCSKGGLIQEGEYGFSMDKGRPSLILPGWYLLTSPLQTFEGKYNAGDDKIIVCNNVVSIIRIPTGSYGFASANGAPEILLPGVHVRRSGQWKFQGTKSVDQDIITYGPIKLLTVKSGTVRVCYHRGKVRIFQEGRYAINDGAFQVASTPLLTQQQNIRFDKHQVLLDGGITLLVEGLLTYQVFDVVKLIKELGEQDLSRAIEDVTKAEIARVFAAIHLEQISSAQKQGPIGGGGGVPKVAPTPSAGSFLGGDSKVTVAGDSNPNNASPYVKASQSDSSRSKICQHVIEFIEPIVEPWGVAIINFQLESTKIADQQYAREYEEASLAMAKAKANLRSVEAENAILLQKASADANAKRIAAEGKASAITIEAQSQGQSRVIDAKSRNEAADLMQDDFARKFALGSASIEFAGALKATTISVIPPSMMGQANLALLGSGGMSSK